MKKKIRKIIEVEVDAEVFAFAELSEKAKQTAIQRRRQENDQDFWWFSEEAISSFKKMGEILGFELSSYSYSLCDYSYTQLKLKDSNLEGMDIRRTMAYIYNNWISPYLDKTKKDMNWMKKPTYGDFWGCPFTGDYYDYTLLDAYGDFIHTHNKGAVFEDFMTILGEKMTKIIMDEAEYRNSDEGVGDDLEINEVLFLEDGSVADIVA